MQQQGNPPMGAADAVRPLRVTFQMREGAQGAITPRRLWKLWSIRRHLPIADCDRDSERGDRKPQRRAEPA